MEILQVIKGRVNGRTKWTVLGLKESFQEPVICSVPFDTFAEAAMELHRIYTTEKSVASAAVE
jgi:hypothetical protein